jgi:hypothetical protein
LQDAFQSVPAPPRVVMVSPPEVPRNASEARAESEGRVRGVGKTGAADNRSIIKAGAPIRTPDGHADS